jgi:hypothetical protein
MAMAVAVVVVKCHVRQAEAVGHDVSIKRGPDFRDD